MATAGTSRGETSEKAHDSDEEEEDYMSESFLAKCVQSDVRPGLKMSHATKREHEALKKKQELALQEAKDKRSSKVAKQSLEEETRKQGLEKGLDQSNKGFAMLQKMGYKQGESLGKDNTGRVEPIPIEVKSNRAGLGREAAVNQIREAKAEFRRRHAEARARSAERQREITAQEFRTHLARKNRTRQTESDLYASQKTCHQIDTEKGFTEPVEAWFWPEQMRVTEKAEGIDTETQNLDREAMEKSGDGDGGDGEPLFGEESSDDESRFKELPPVTTNTYRSSGSATDQPLGGDGGEEEEEEFSAEEKLQILTGYLRSQYFYCLWCGFSYADSDELKNSCPGPTREDHDD